MRDYIVHHTKLFLDHQTHIHRAPAKDGQRAVRDPNDASRCSWSIGLAFWYALRGFVRVHKAFRGLKRWRWPCCLHVVFFCFEYTACSSLTSSALLVSRGVKALAHLFSAESMATVRDIFIPTRKQEMKKSSQPFLCSRSDCLKTF
jgi:hypothetical protein